MVEPDSAPPPHPPLAIRRLLMIACVMAIGIAGLWMLIERFSDVDVTDPPPPPPTESPIATPTQDGEIPPRSGSLPDLLRYAPDLFGDNSLPLTDVARYADIQTWMASRGLAAPGAQDSAALAAWRTELGNLALSEGLSDRGLEPEWLQAYGFDLRQIDQVLVVGQAPDYVTILRGRFDRTSLYDAWVGSGYQAVEAEGMTIWTLFPGDTIDLSDSASRPAMGMLNNVVLLEDGTLVGAAKLPRLRSVLRVMDGRDASLADNAAVGSLVAPATDSEDLVSAVIVSGSFLHALPSQLPRSLADRGSLHATVGQSLLTVAGEAMLATRMPRVELVMVGILLSPPRDSGATPATVTAHPLPDPQLRLVLSFDDIDDARSAREVVGQRFSGHRSPVTGAAYDERYGSARIRVLDAPGDPALVEVEATLPRGAADWLAMLRDRDVGFAFWLAADASGDD